MIFLRYWLFPALISFSWFKWRFQIYKNEFEIIDNELKACVEWGKYQGIFLPERSRSLSLNFSALACNSETTFGV